MLKSINPYRSLQSWLDHYDKVAGVELLFAGNQLSQLNVVFVEKETDNVRVVKQERLKGLSDLEHLLDKTIPIALVFSGKQVLARQVDKQMDSFESAVSSVLPNAKTEDFVCQVVSDNKTSWLGLIRREIVIEVLNKFANEGYAVLSVMVGALALETLLPVLSLQEKTIQTPCYQIFIHDNKISQIVYNPGEESFAQLSLAGDTYSEEFLLAFAGAMSLIIPLGTNIFPEKLLTGIKEQYRNEKLLKPLGWGILIGVFSLLLVNFLVYTYLNQKNQTINIELAYHQKQLQELTQLQKKVEEQKSFFQQNGILKASRNSYYADRLAAGLPEGIRLTELLIFPKQDIRYGKENEGYRFEDNLIRVSGNTQRSSYLNKWIHELEQMDWVEQVEVLPYKEQTNGQGTFVLAILLNQSYSR